MPDSVVNDDVIAEEDVKNDFDILLPDGYRDNQGENPANSLNKDWIDLFEENGTYYFFHSNLISFSTSKPGKNCALYFLMELLNIQIPIFYIIFERHA